MGVGEDGEGVLVVAVAGGGNDGVGDGDGGSCYGLGHSRSLSVAPGCWASNLRMPLEDQWLQGETKRRLNDSLLVIEYSTMRG